MNLREACSLVNDATTKWNEAVARYGDKRQRLYELQATADRLEESNAGSKELAKRYLLIAKEMDDIRDAASDLTYCLGDMANMTRQFARILASCEG